jgi:hypothetical protein
MRQIVSTSGSNKVDNPFAQITRSDLIALAGLISVTRGKGKPQRDRHKSQLKAIDVIVWLWLQTYTRPDRPWTVSQSTIARALLVDRRTINRSVARLRLAQVVQTKPDLNRGGATLWTISPSHLWALERRRTTCRKAVDLPLDSSDAQGHAQAMLGGMLEPCSSDAQGHAQAMLDHMVTSMHVARGGQACMSQVGGHAACPSGVGMQHVSHTDNLQTQITHTRQIQGGGVCNGFATQEAEAATAATTEGLTIDLLVDGGMSASKAAQIVRSFARDCPDDRVLRKAVYDTITVRLALDKSEPTADPTGHAHFERREGMTQAERRRHFAPDHRALGIGQTTQPLCGLVAHRLMQSLEHRAQIIDKYTEIDARYQRWIAAGRPTHEQIRQAEREQAERAQAEREQARREQAEREDAARRQDAARREQARLDAEREAAAKRDHEQALQAALDALSDGQRADLERERDAMIEAEADRALAAIPAGWSAEQTASVRRITERQRANAIGKAQALAGLDCPHRRAIIERRIGKAVAVA